MEGERHVKTWHIKHDSRFRNDIPVCHHLDFTGGLCVNQKGGPRFCNRLFAALGISGVPENVLCFLRPGEQGGESVKNTQKGSLIEPRKVGTFALIHNVEVCEPELGRFCKTALFFF